MMSKFLLSFCEMVKPLIVTQLILYIANMHDDGQCRTHLWAYQCGFTFLVVEILTNLIWENLLFSITQQVHISQNALKAVLIKKNFAISRASSTKTYSSGEVHNLIERDANAIWMLLGQLPDLLQIPFELTVSMLFVYWHVGFFALPGLLLYSLAIAVNVYA